MQCLGSKDLPAAPAIESVYITLPPTHPPLTTFARAGSIDLQLTVPPPLTSLPPAPTMLGAMAATKYARMIPTETAVT